MNATMVDLRRNNATQIKLGSQADSEQASKTPAIVIKRLVKSAEIIRVYRYRNIAIVSLMYPFLGVKNHVRAVIFQRSETIDPLLWDYEDVEDFVADLIAEQEFKERAALA